MPLTPEDVANKQFTSTRLKPGYDETEVDEFLDEVEAELTRLYRENDELRNKVSAAARGGAAEAPAAVPASDQDAGRVTQENEELRQKLTAAQRQVTEANSRATAAQQAAQAAQQAAQEAAAQAPAAPAPAAPAATAAGGAESATGILALAQRTADEHIAEARTQADRMIAESRTRADQLKREAEDKHRQTIGTLETERATLERKVEELRAFEREYRTRLKSYLEGQLRELEGRSTEAPAGQGGSGGPGGASGPGGSQPGGQGSQPGQGAQGGGQPARTSQPGQPAGESGGRPGQSSQPGQQPPRSPFSPGSPVAGQSPSGPPEQPSGGHRLEDGPQG